jgi:hypothetical protein
MRASITSLLERPLVGAAGTHGGGSRLMLPLFNDECLRQRRRTDPIDALLHPAAEQSLQRCIIGTAITSRIRVPKL